MHLNRAMPPKSSELEDINYLKPVSVNLSNGNSLHTLIRKDANIAKIEVQYDAGYVFQRKPLIASSVNALILEGSKKMNSREIAEYFDGEGAFLENSCSPDKASITLYCLKKSARKLCAALFEILDNACFKEEEIDKYFRIKKQKFIVNKGKVGFQARNSFLDVLVGNNNSYSNSIEETDFDVVNRKELLDFYECHYLNGVKDVFISGGIGEDDLDVIKRYLNNSSSNSLHNRKELNLQIVPSRQNQVLIQDEGAIQSAIRMGQLTFGKSNPLFPKLFMLNTILGGYFGSRLMKNIREEKGFTYGIGSGLVNFRDLSYLVIATEVGIEFTQQTLTEIYKEIDVLKKSEITKQELNSVKNYILGNLLRGFDGVFESMDRFKGLFNFDLDYSYYSNFIKEVRSANSLDIKMLANDVFEQSNIKIVIAGKL